MSWKKLILLNIFLLIIGAFAIIWGTDYMRERQVIQDEKRRLDLYDKILDGASTGPTQMTIDYSKQISTGSPLIFGGSHAPEIAHQDAWNQIQEIGITIIRKDLFPEKAIPNTTVEDYKNNKNGVADPKNWNQNEINKIKDIFINARKRNIKTMGILSYTPNWLTYNNTTTGVPRDWEVFEDIAKKTYLIYRDYIEYIEIWNEPDWKVFLNLQGSNMTMEDAYENMFYHASKAIREVDKEKNDGKRILIGGPTASDTVNSSLLEALISSDRSKDKIDFVSYHNYELKENRYFPEPSWNKYKSVLQEYNLEKPFFITEWNYTASGYEKSDPYNTGSTAIAYTANKFISFLKMGLFGANYHVLEPLNLKKPNEGEGYFGFYKWKNDKSELLTQARSWRIFSKQMKLGKGESAIFGTNLESSSKNQELRDEGNSLLNVMNQMLEPETLNTIGFKNIDGEYGTAIVNSSDQSLVLETTLQNTTLKSFTKVRVYYASAGNDAKLPVYEGELKADKNGTIRFPFYIPRETVVGMVFTEDKAWYENLHLPI